MRGLLSRFSESAGAIVPGLFSVGTWFVSQFFLVPFNEDFFRAGSILGMLAGYALGNLHVGGKAPARRRWVALTIAAALVLSVIVMVDYYFLVDRGHIDSFWVTVRAVLELAVVFGCAGYMMPVAGITFAKPEDAEKPADARPEDAKKPVEAPQPQ